MAIALFRSRMDSGHESTLSLVTACRLLKKAGMHRKMDGREFEQMPHSEEHYARGHRSTRD
jgi:hypothetical protein